MRYCPNCGRPTDGREAARAARKKSLNYPLIIAKLLIVASLVCFFFTFMSVSCGNSAQEFTGIHFIFGSDPVEDFADGLDAVIGGDFAHQFAEEYNAGSIFGSGRFVNVFVLASALTGLLALFTRRRFSGVMSILSAALLLGFRLTATQYYRIDNKPLSDYGGLMMQIDFGYPLYFATVLFIAGGVAMLLSADYRPRTYTPPPPPPDEHYTYPDRFSTPFPPDSSNKQNTWGTQYPPNSGAPPQNTSGAPYPSGSGNAAQNSSWGTRQSGFGNAQQSAYGGLSNSSDSTGSGNSAQSDSLHPRQSYGKTAQPVNDGSQQGGNGTSQQSYGETTKPDYKNPQQNTPGSPSGK